MQFDMEICGSFRKVYRIEAGSPAEARREMERRWAFNEIAVHPVDVYEAKVHEAGTTWDDDGNNLSAE